MMFKGHASFSKHSAEAPEIAQSPAQTQHAVQHVVPLHVPVFSGNVNNKKIIVICVKILDAAEK